MYLLEYVFVLDFETTVTALLVLRWSNTFEQSYRVINHLYSKR